MSTMLDLDILTSDSDLELDAVDEQKPRKKYEVSIQYLNYQAVCKGVGNLVVEKHWGIFRGLFQTASKQPLI